MPGPVIQRPPGALVGPVGNITWGPIASHPVGAGVTAALVGGALLGGLTGRWLDRRREPPQHIPTFNATNLDEIVLGSRTARPSGTYLPPDLERRATQIALEGYPKTEASWRQVASDYPYVSPLVKHVSAAPVLTRMIDTIRGTPTAAFVRDESIFVAPALEGLDDDQRYEVLVHELSHRAQQSNYPTEAESDAAYFSPKQSYRHRYGEEQAYGVEDAAHLRRAIARGGGR